MKQKANKYSSYFTPKILIAVAILLIIVDKPLFVNDASSLLAIILFIPYFILNINIEYIFINVLVTTGTIGSIIIIAIGYIYLSFPIVDYSARHLNIPINTHEISRARFGSKLLILSGFGLFIHFLKLIEFENLYLNILLLLCVIGTFLQKYDVSSYPHLYMIYNDFLKSPQAHMYIDDMDKIKNLKIPNNSIINWGYLVKNVDSEDELEWEFLHIRNDIESFIHVLICAFLISGLLGGVLLESLLLLSVFFIGGFFLIIICPNAIDTMRTKTSCLFTRIYSVVGMFSYGMVFFIYPTFSDLLGFIVFVISMIIGFIAIMCLYGIYERERKTPFIDIRY